jgi:uncharacterized protein YlxP (DUF503 family)
MFVGVARITLSIPGARSLKDRRRVVKSLKDRLRARLSVSVAEVGNVELHQLSTLGVAVLSSDSQRCSAVLGKAVAMARVQRDALLTDVATEIVSFGHGGKNLRGGVENLLEDDLDDGELEDE